jgi:hypothetical protein
MGAAREVRMHAHAHNPREKRNGFFFVLAPRYDVVGKERKDLAQFKFKPSQVPRF